MASLCVDCSQHLPSPYSVQGTMLGAVGDAAMWNIVWKARVKAVGKHHVLGPLTCVYPGHLAFPIADTQEATVVPKVGSFNLVGKLPLASSVFHSKRSRYM